MPDDLPKLIAELEELEAKAKAPAASLAALADFFAARALYWPALLSAAKAVPGLVAIINRLPKTADGVPVTPGMDLWFITPVDGSAIKWRIGPDLSKAREVCIEYDPAGSSYEVFAPSDCYSTRVAALAASAPAETKGEGA